jgi:hypothetical protein
MIRFPYRPDLQSGVSRWRPLGFVYLRGSANRRRHKALFDTGSDDIVCPFWLASHLGVQLGTSQRHRIVWRGQSFPMQFGSVELELSDGWAGFRWSAAVGFSPAPIPYMIFGIRGGLEFFDATFCGKDLGVEFTINSSFHGTVF